MGIITLFRNKNIKTSKLGHKHTVLISQAGHNTTCSCTNALTASKTCTKSLATTHNLFEKCSVTFAPPCIFHTYDRQSADTTTKFMGWPSY
jgi:hypothetical protein